ncbi:MAG: hypothetical protein JWO68_755 [Actinomycetia bacterium]|nr:hypothetical protein [Actinomycetes bacterium]
MKGKWAQGIVPRNFAWVIKDQLAVSERLGGYGTNHRKVRRQEEIIWVREQGFTRIISLLPSPHNLHAYDELGVEWLHYPYGKHDDPITALEPFWRDLRHQLAAGDKVIVHYDELGDRLEGAMGGYLVYAGLVPEQPRAVAIVEHVLGRQMGPSAREIVAAAVRLVAKKP